MNQINNLHIILTNNFNNINLKPLILFVIFMIRWKRVSKLKLPFIIDPNSLTTFISNSSSNLFTKISDISSKFKKIFN